MTKHKYSTGALAMLGGLLIIMFAVAQLESSDIDDVCNTSGKILKRNTTGWACADDATGSGSVNSSCTQTIITWIHTGYSGVGTGSQTATNYTNLDTAGKTYTCLDCYAATTSSEIDCNTETGSWIYCEFSITC